MGEHYNLQRLINHPHPAGKVTLRFFQISHLTFVDKLFAVHLFYPMLGSLSFGLAVDAQPIVKSYIIYTRTTVVDHVTWAELIHTATVLQ